MADAVEAKAVAVKPTMAEAIKATENIELPDDLRIPLHSLQADVDWLAARIVSDPDQVDLFKESIRNRLSQIEMASYRIAFASALSPSSSPAGDDHAWRPL